jgi:hypothetical protein
VIKASFVCVCVCIVIIDVCLFVCVANTGTGIGGQNHYFGTGSFRGAAGYGSAVAPCCGGGGGFYSAGGTDTLYSSFPGGQGFQQGGAGAIPASGYGPSHQTGGFGGGGTAEVVGLCKAQAGACELITWFFTSCTNSLTQENFDSFCDFIFIIIIILLLLLFNIIRPA